MPAPDFSFLTVNKGHSVMGHLYLLFLSGKRREERKGWRGSLCLINAFSAASIIWRPVW